MPTRGAVEHGHVTAEASRQLASELQRANEQLVLSNIREQELAEEARTAERALDRLLQRKSVLADANALLNGARERRLRA